MLHMIFFFYKYFIISKKGGAQRKLNKSWVRMEQICSVPIFAQPNKIKITI
ncbi:hypothetical protein BA6E_124101 [Bacteroidales bacterium 6E]|nr:hypothetical protein BA6E_124101 [Bacteroidales bacterium 6E]